MKIRTVINRIKAECPTFGGRVSGSAEYAAAVDALESVRLDLPAAFVYRSGGVASDAATIGAVVQMVQHNFGIIIALDNGTDAAGFAASEALDTIIDELVAALLGWQPDDTHNAFVFVRDEHLDLNRGRLWHVALFMTEAAIESRSDVNA